MSLRMRTRSAGRPNAESQGGGTGGRVGRGGGRGRRPREGNDELVDDLNGQGNDQCIGANGDIEGVNRNVEGANEGALDFSMIISQQLQDLLPAMLAQVGCPYKEFLACNPKEYNGKGGVVVLTRWIEKIKNVQDMSGCSINQKVKYTDGLFVGKALTAGHAAYTDRFHELARLVPHLVTPKSNRIERYVYGLAPHIREMVAAMKPKTMQKAGNLVRIRMVGTVIRELRLRMFCYYCKPCRKREYRSVPRNMNPVNARNPHVRACYECGSTDHVRPACLRLNRVQGPEGNRPNQVTANNGGQGRENQGNQARGRAFMLGAEEAR
nr:hypothetical protein [Tanacetum cinerariifolium]